MCVDVCGCVQQREKEDRQSLTYPRVIGVVLLPESLMKGMVFRKLQRMGVQIIETTPEKFGAELVSRYLDIKRRELI